MGTVKNTLEKNTTNSDTTGPFVLENKGNIKVNVTFTSPPVFESVDFPSDNYQFKIEENETGALDLTASYTNWTDVTNSSSAPHMAMLDWNTTMNAAETHLKVVVPSNELAGNQSFTVTFTARYGSYE